MNQVDWSSISLKNKFVHSKSTFSKKSFKKVQFEYQDESYYYLVFSKIGLQICSEKLKHFISTKHLFIG